MKSNELRILNLRMDKVIQEAVLISKSINNNRHAKDWAKGVLDLIHVQKQSIQLAMEVEEKEK